MKTDNLIVAVIIILFLCASCEKADKDRGIAYYQNKIGEGYLFGKFENDSIVPISNSKIEIKFYAPPSDLGPTFGDRIYVDYVYTDDDGKYSFRFVKKIDSKKVFKCHVSEVYSPLPEGISMPSNFELGLDIFKKSNKIVLDTIFYYPGVLFPDEL